MKLASNTNEQGSVLITAFLTITILTMICATSLYVTSQNQNSGMQTASWQQALSGAESGVDMAIRALNTGSWSNQWYTYSYGNNTFPNTKPPYAFSSPSGTATPSSPYPTATAAPGSGQYNYHFLGTSAASPEISFSGISGSTSTSEGNTAIWGWVTVDTGSLSATSAGQWYRIRSTGVATTNGLFRASNNRLDNDLRNTIGLRFDRKQGGVPATPQATRTIEVIMQPLVNGTWKRGVTLRNQITMSGGGVIDSFDSSNPFKSTNGLYDITKRQNHGDIATINSNGSSDLKSTYIYGNLSYSGSPVKNTTNVQGTISTPFNSTISNTSDPTWTSGSYTSYSSGSPPFSTITTGSKSNPKLIKVNGDFTVPGGQTLTITSGNSGNDNNYITIWVTGKLTTSGSGLITQDSTAKVTWIVDSDITVSGQSFNNAGNVAANLTIIGVGSNNKATISGSGVFIGTLNAPNYDVTISGSGGFSGALIADTLNISGGASFHYDEALGAGGGSATIGNYAFASWFEDNSDPTRKDINGNKIIY